MSVGKLDWFIFVDMTGSIATIFIYVSGKTNHNAMLIKGMLFSVLDFSDKRPFLVGELLDIEISTALQLWAQ